jgi:hypothetical protein
MHLPVVDRIVDGKAVWTSVQSPRAAHDLVVKFLGLPGEMLPST